MRFPTVFDESLLLDILKITKIYKCIVSVLGIFIYLLIYASSPQTDTIYITILHYFFYYTTSTPDWDTWLPAQDPTASAYYFALAALIIACVCLLSTQ